MAGAVEKAPPGVDVDWEDEDEATHIFDESHEAPKAAAAAAASAPPGAKMTLLGVTAPTSGLPPPPPLGSRPPPPPAPISSQPPRMSGFPPVPSSSAAGLPLPIASHIPPPPGTTPGLGTGYPSRTPSAPAPAPLRMSAPPTASMQTVHTPFPRPAAVPEYLSPHPAMESTALFVPPPSRTGCGFQVGLVAGALLVLAFLFFTPRTGLVVVDVTDAKGGSANHVDIFVDGRKQCETAPCIVDQVAAGRTT